MAQLNDIINELTMQMGKLSLGPGSVSDYCQPRTRRQALMARDSNAQPGQPPVVAVPTESRKILGDQIFRHTSGNENATMGCSPVALARRSTRIRHRKLHFDELGVVDIVKEMKRKPTQLLQENVQNGLVEIRRKFTKSLGVGRENKVSELKIEEKRHLTNCTKVITKYRGKGCDRKFQRVKKVRFLNEVQVYLVVKYDETRSCKDWHKNLTKEGLISAQKWRQELDQEEPNNEQLRDH